MEVLLVDDLSDERESELRSRGARVDATGRWLIVPDEVDDPRPDASLAGVDADAVVLSNGEFSIELQLPDEADDAAREKLGGSRWRSTDDPRVYTGGVYRLSRAHDVLADIGLPVVWREVDRTRADEMVLRHYQERAGGEVMILLERYDPDHYLVERIVDNAQQTWYREDGLLMIGPPAYNKNVAELAEQGATCIYDPNLVDRAEGEGVDTDTDVKLRVAKDMVANPCRFRIIEGSMAMAKELADHLNAVGERETDTWLVAREDAVGLVEWLRERGVEMVTRRLDEQRNDYEHWRPNLPMDRGPGRPIDREPVEDPTLEETVPGLKPHTVLDDHQRTGAAYIRERDYQCVVGDEMGLGKTLTSLSAAQFLDSPKLVVCPSNARQVWPREIEKWVDAEYHIMAPGDDVEATLDHVQSSDVDYVIVSYDGMDRFYDVVDETDWSMVIIDEAHYLRNRRTKRVQLARELLLDIPRRVLLTGTPLMNDPSELRSLLYFVHPDEWEDASWFRRRFEKPWERGTAQVREQVVERLHEYLDDVMIRRVKAEIFHKLPDKHTEVHQVDLTPGWRREYQEEESQYAAEQDAGSDALGSLQRLNRLRQLAVNGKLEDVIPHLQRLLDTGEKVVVFGFFLSGLRTLAEEFEDANPVVLTGSSSDTQRENAVQGFQNDDDCRLFLGQINAAGQAITLTSARHVVFLDLVWNPSVMRQAMDRVHRRGQERSVHVHFFVTEDTIEEDIRTVLEDKARLVDAVVDDAAYRDMEAVQWEITERMLERRDQDARAES